VVQSQINKIRSTWETVCAKFNSKTNPSTYTKTNGKQVNFKDNKKAFMSLAQENSNGETSEDFSSTP
jgi:hypothetical protein